MKKVLVISSFPAPYRVELFKKLAKQYDLTIFFSSMSNENRNSKWFEKSGELKFDIVNNREAQNKFKYEIKNIKKYDFVLPYEPSNKLAIKVIFYCRLHNIPYYVNCDGAILRKNFLKDILKHFIFSGATACFSSGKSATNYFRYYGVCENKIFLHKFTSLTSSDILSKPVTNEERSLERKQLGLEDRKTIISVGQFIHRKGFDVLLKAWTKVKGNCQLLIIGGGDEKEKYENYIQENNLSNAYILEFMEKNLLFKYYRASDFFVLPTREDIWGLVINEAMAVGLPVITTNNCVAGNELIDEGSNGYLVAVEDEDALADKIQYLLDNIEIIENMRTNAINKIKDYTIENIARSHIKVIEETLPERKK